MTCKKCGAPLDAGAVFCSACGTRTQEATPQPPVTAPQPPVTVPQPPVTAPQPTYPVPQQQYNGQQQYGGAYGGQPYPPYYYARPADASSMGFAVLSFFLPLIGLILYLVWKDEYPLRAKSAGKGALIGVITSVALVLLCFIVIFLIFGVLISSMPYYYY